MPHKKDVRLMWVNCVVGGGGGGGGGGVNLRSVSSQDADKMVILGSFIPRNYVTFYWNNILFGIKLQLRS